MSTQITGNSITSVLKKFAKKLSGKEIEGNSTTEVLEDFANKYDGGGGGGEPVPTTYTLMLTDMYSYEPIANMTLDCFVGQAVTLPLQWTSITPPSLGGTCQIGGYAKGDPESGFVGGNVCVIPEEDASKNAIYMLVYELA